MPEPIDNADARAEALSAEDREAVQDWTELASMSQVYEAVAHWLESKRAEWQAAQQPETLLPHMVTFPNGAAYSCACDITENHEAVSITPEQYAKLIQDAALTAALEGVAAREAGMLSSNQQPDSDSERNTNA